MVVSTVIPRKGRSLAKKQEILVIGLGRFGRALARELVDLGHDVMGADYDTATVQSVTRDLQHVVQVDATDMEAMREIGAQDFETAVVAIGTDTEASILATYLLVDMKVPHIWAKAITGSHGAILERVGAHRVVFPERDMGIRVAHTLTGRTIDYLELDPQFALVETTVPREVSGKMLKEAELRRRFGLTVVCIKPPGGQFTYATPETMLREGDILVVAGEPRKAEEFASLD
jgi:trk system potassium uptake protein TrkA